MRHPFPILTADEAAELVQNGETVSFSGFTPAGTPKAIPAAIARKAGAEHAAGRPFKINILTGASTGPSLDGALARADAVSWRTPYQSNPDLRKGINSGHINFFDMHLSMAPQNARYGFLGPVKWCILEACDILPDGRIVLTTAVGGAPTYVRMADKVLIELNRRHPAALMGFHDIYEPADPPHRREIPIYRPSDRIGSPYVMVNPRKIAGVVETNLQDETGSFDSPSDVTTRIGQNVAEFLAGEMRRGTMPSSFLPVQSGVGDIANAVIGAMGKHPDIPAFEMYSEVAQDSVISLIQAEKLKFASATSITVSGAKLTEIYDNLEFFRPRMVLRPQELTNHPECVRRMGVISINTAIEVDCFGNVNSTHILGRNMMNGIGGSADFTRNAYVSIFTCPSTQKLGKISTIVPLVSHMDHSEHSVQVIITEQGVADLRCKSPAQRARHVIERCAHPDYRDVLRKYIELSKDGHTPHTLARAFCMHQALLETGSMRDVQF